MRTRRTMILVIVVAFLTLLWIASGVRAHPPADGPTGEGGVTIGSTMSLLMKYQGRLLDPASGDLKPDGTYSMTFSIYDVSTGGSALWAETKGVEVEGGLFNTILGDVASLSQSIFTGQDLWLGIKVGADAETSPRQQLLPMPYAIYARNADTVDGMEGVDLEESAEIDADVGAHAAIADAHHPRYTDAEAWAAVLANDGAGSSLDADLLDGLDSSAFGDITAVAAGTGLSGGGTSGAVTLSADTTYLQRRVIGTCASGNAIRVVGADGTVTCEADDDTTYTAGSGLSLTDTTFSVDFAGSGIATTVARSDHNHSAADITSGTLSNYRFSAYDDLLAEDYLNNDASGDLLTRSQADGRYVNEGQADSITSAMITDGEVARNDLADGAALAEILDDDGAGSGLDADLLDGWDSSDFAFAGHNHWGETWMGADTGLTLLGGTIGLSGSGSESGVYGESSGGHGVHGLSETSNGVFGRSGLGSGVYGESDSGYGVHGYGKDSYGGYFNSDTGLALHAAGDATVTGDLTVDGSLIGGEHTHTGADIVDESIGTDDLAHNAVTTAKIADGNVTSDDIEDRAQMISFPANALNYEPGTTIQEFGTGLLWQYHYAQGAYLIISRPVDWDGESDVVMHLYFFPTTDTSGDVQFFIRPRAFDPGDAFTDASSFRDDPVPVSQDNIVQEQVITIPASRFGSGALWVITIQRQGSQSTYPDDVVLMSVALSYNAVR